MSTPVFSNLKAESIIDGSTYQGMSSIAFGVKHPDHIYAVPDNGAESDDSGHVYVFKASTGAAVATITLKTSSGATLLNDDFESVSCVQDDAFNGGVATIVVCDNMNDGEADEVNVYIFEEPDTLTTEDINTEVALVSSIAALAWNVESSSLRPGTDNIYLVNKTASGFVYFVFSWAGRDVSGKVDVLADGIDSAADIATTINATELVLNSTEMFIRQVKHVFWRPYNPALTMAQNISANALTRVISFVNQRLEKIGESMDVPPDGHIYTIGEYAAATYTDSGDPYDISTQLLKYRREPYAPLNSTVNLIKQVFQDSSNLVIIQNWPSGGNDVVVDNSGQNNDGLMWPDGAFPVTTDTSNWNGVKNYITCDDTGDKCVRWIGYRKDLINVAGAFFMSAWISTTDIARSVISQNQYSTGDPVSQDDGTLTQSNCFALAVANDGKVDLRTYDGGTATIGVSRLKSVTAVNDGSWHWVCALRRVTTNVTEVYTDGIKTNSGVTADVGQVGVIEIGFNGSRGFDGDVGPVIISGDFSPTESQIKQIYDFYTGSSLTRPGPLRASCLVG